MVARTAAVILAGPAVALAAASGPGILPSPDILAWQRLEFGMFCHFGINTFSNKEWSDGTLSPTTFNPTDFDARQWTRVAKQLGINYLVITAKHHDGFCTFPSAHTDYSVKSSPWRDGHGDVIRAVADACRADGIKFGFYLSPWDRHEPTYADNAAYDRYYMAQLREVLTNYGPVTEVWCDGAGTKGHVYDWAAYRKLVKQLQPHALIAIAGHADIRWVGNEQGVAPESVWYVADGRWFPPECDVPIRGHWFYHTDDLPTLKSTKQLVDIYYHSVGRGANLLLNVAPDRRGRLPDEDVARLRETVSIIRAELARDLAAGRPVTATSAASPPAAVLDSDLDTHWMPASDDAAPAIEIDLGPPTRFDRVMLREAIELGQRVNSYALEAFSDDAWRDIHKGTSIGNKRIERLAPVTATKVRLRITGSNGPPAITKIALYFSRANS